MFRPHDPPFSFPFRLAQTLTKFPSGLCLDLYGSSHRLVKNQYSPNPPTTPRVCKARQKQILRGACPERSRRTPDDSSSGLIEKRTHWVAFLPTTSRGCHPERSEGSAFRFLIGAAAYRRISTFVIKFCAIRAEKFSAPRFQPMVTVLRSYFRSGPTSWNPEFGIHYFLFRLVRVSPTSAVERINSCFSTVGCKSFHYIPTISSEDGNDRPSR